MSNEIELVAAGTLRGDNWTLAIFPASSGDGTWTAHAKFCDDGHVQIGFKNKDEAAAWAVEALKGLKDDRAIG